MKIAGIISLFMLMLCQPALAQSGREFWFVAPDATSGHADNPIYMRVSTFNQAANITLSLPANPGFTPLTVNLAANSSHTFNLTPYLNTIESRSFNTVLTNGILIEATTDITAYYEVGASNNTDIFALKGDNALGKDFMISAQQYWRNGSYNPQPRAATAIVATEDNTIITITPTNTLDGHPANVPFTVSLDQGETYSIRANDRFVADRYGGTTITSNKPIAVTISDDSIENNNYGGCKDIIGDQTIPTTNIGKEYIITRGFLYRSYWYGTFINPDRIYIMATENNTDVYLDGSNTPITLNRGDTYEVTLYDPNLYISSTKDVYVMHVTGFGCEVGMAIVPSVYCTGSTEVSFQRSQTGDFYMIVMVPDGFENGFLVNGDATLLTAGDFSAVPGTNGNWRAARVTYNNTTIKVGENYRVTNSKSKFHLGIINGGASTGCLYGYFTDFASVATGPIYHH